MFYNILDAQRQSILPLLSAYKKDFYLAGGTALALHFGHRDSVDFDFFTNQEFDTGQLFAALEKTFIKHQIIKIQEEKNTLTVIIDQQIKLSFFLYGYPLLNPLQKEPNLNIASIQDIACMKLAAIVSRATEKDYVDLYFILQQWPLADLITKAEQKFINLEPTLILKSLIYFQDIDTEEVIMFKGQNQVSMETIQAFLIKEVKAFEAANT